MWIEIKDARKTDGEWVSKNILAPIAYIPVSEYTLEKLTNAKEEDTLLALHGITCDIIGVSGDEVVNLGYSLAFMSFRIVPKEQEKTLLNALKSGNFAVNDKDRVCFNDLQSLCFEVDGNILTYDDFRKYELQKGKVFKLVHDNGFSYTGSDPFRGTAKEYADAAIRAAQKIGYVWSGWRYGFRLTDAFCIDVVYGEDESYHEVSFS
jgi:hypothetical protein